MKYNIVSEDSKEKIKGEFYSLYYTLTLCKFEMGYFISDMATTFVYNGTLPKAMQFQWDRVLFSFEKIADAKMFHGWLLETDKMARDCFRNMPG